MPQKAVFLDRDDTIMEDSGYINSPQQVKLIPGAAQALVDLRKMGYKIIVVSNQSGIARGIITEQAIAQIHERLKQLLAEAKRVSRQNLLLSLSSRRGHPEIPQRQRLAKTKTRNAACRR